MSKIEIKNLTFGYGQQAKPIFNNVNLNIDTSWKFGLIGRNGRGKTTLLNLLQNKFEYHGTITHQQNFVYFPQTITDKTQLTMYVLNELTNAEQWEIERELNLLNVSPDVLWRSFDSLSGGEQTKVLLSIMFIEQDNFPLIDEPTNHLDIKGREQVAEYLRKKKQGFIVVSHDRSFIDSVVDHILSIEKSQLLLFQGNFSVYEEQKNLRDQSEQAENNKLKKDIGRLKQTAAEKAEWSRSREGDKLGNPKVKGSGGIADTGAIGADSARAMKRSLNIVHRMQREITDKEKLLQDIEHIDELSMSYEPNYHQTLLEVRDLRLGYSNWLFNPISFKVRQCECVALVGPNGSGKSTIIQKLLGNFIGQDEGKVNLVQNLRISYVRQNYEDNQGTLADFAAKNGLNYREFLNNLHKLGMEREVFTNKIELMSMGQRKKVELAKSLSLPAEFYIWDEPLNYLDVFNQEQIEQLILAFKPTMLIVEHDQKFIENVATKTINLAK